MVLVLNAALVAGLVVVGLAAHSLAVLAAGADYLADAGAIGVALLAIWLAGMPPSPARPAGYPNATKVAALRETFRGRAVERFSLSPESRGQVRYLLARLTAFSKAFISRSSRCMAACCLCSWVWRLA